MPLTSQLNTHTFVNITLILIFLLVFLFNKYINYRFFFPKGRWGGGHFQGDGSVSSSILKSLVCVKNTSYEMFFCFQACPCRLMTNMFPEYCNVQRFLRAIMSLFIEEQFISRLMYKVSHSTLQSTVSQYTRSASRQRVS